MKGLTLKNSLEKSLNTAFFYSENHAIKMAFILIPEEGRL